MQGRLGSDSWSGTRSHMPQLRVCMSQLRILHATTKTWHRQINKYKATTTNWAAWPRLWKVLIWLKEGWARSTCSDVPFQRNETSVLPFYGASKGKTLSRCLSFSSLPVHNLTLFPFPQFEVCRFSYRSNALVIHGVREGESSHAMKGTCPRWPESLEMGPCPCWSDVMGYLCPRLGTVVCDDLAWRDANRTSWILRRCFLLSGKALPKQKDTWKDREPERPASPRRKTVCGWGL